MFISTNNIYKNEGLIFLHFFNYDLNKKKTNGFFSRKRVKEILKITKKNMIIKYTHRDP